MLVLGRSVVVCGVITESRCKKIPTNHHLHSMLDLEVGWSELGSALHKQGSRGVPHVGHRSRVSYRPTACAGEEDSATDRHPEAIQKVFTRH